MQAYRGHLIRQNPLTGAWWVEKGGFLLQWVNDEAHGRRVIDALLGD